MPRLPGTTMTTGNPFAGELAGEEQLSVDGDGRHVGCAADRLVVVDRACGGNLDSAPDAAVAQGDGAIAEAGRRRGHGAALHGASVLGASTLATGRDYGNRRRRAATPSLTSAHLCANLRQAAAVSRRAGRNGAPAVDRSPPIFSTYVAAPSLGTVIGAPGALPMLAALRVAAVRRCT